jgi:hypothetical protein
VNRSLADDLRSGPLHHGEVVWIGRSIADHLDRLHRVDVVRGIVRPEDILWTGADRPVLARSVAPFLAGEEDLVAPEVRAGASATIAADIYSLGATLCSALTAAPVDLDHPALLTAAAEDVPPGLIEVLEKATARWPIDRYFTAAAFRDALDRVLEPRERVGAPRAVKLAAFALVIVLVGYLGILVAGARAGESLFDPATAAAGPAGEPVRPVNDAPATRGPDPVAAQRAVADASQVAGGAATSPVAVVGPDPVPTSTPTSTGSVAADPMPPAVVRPADPMRPAVVRPADPAPANRRSEEAPTAKAVKVKAPADDEKKPTSAKGPKDHAGDLEARAGRTEAS